MRWSSSIGTSEATTYQPDLLGNIEDQLVDRDLYEPPKEGWYFGQELTEVNPINVARIVTNYLRGLVAEAGRYANPES